LYLLTQHLPHSVHLYLPVWIFICSVSLLRDAKRFSHWVHEHQFSPACKALCLVKFSFVVNRLWHIVHKYGLGLSSRVCLVVSLWSGSIFISDVWDLTSIALSTYTQHDNLTVSLTWHTLQWSTSTKKAGTPYHATIAYIICSIVFHDTQLSLLSNVPFPKTLSDFKLDWQVSVCLTMTTYLQRWCGPGHITLVMLVIMAALHSRCRHYIFILWFLLSSFFSSPNLSGRRLDVYHTSTHGVALVQI